jgi:hypothetical protein
MGVGDWRMLGSGRTDKIRNSGEKRNIEEEMPCTIKN